MIKKMNISIAISQNFNNVKLEFLDEPVEYETEEELKEGVRKRFKILREEIEKEFGEIQR